MKIKSLDFCIGNANEKMDSLLDHLVKQDEHITIRHWQCLSNCSTCYRKIFVLLNEQQFMEANTVMELFTKLQSL